MKWANRERVRQIEHQIENPIPDKLLVYVPQGIAHDDAASFRNSSTLCYPYFLTKVHESNYTSSRLPIPADPRSPIAEHDVDVYYRRAQANRINHIAATVLIRTNDFKQRNIF